MGGQAFLAHSPPLPTPRMPPDIYNLVLERTHSLLTKHYTHVSSPIEAPGKSTYGDIDIVVFGALSPAYDPSVVPQKTVNSLLGELLNAKASINGSGTVPLTLAIPWPESQTKNKDEKEEEKYIQIDLHISHSLKSYTWELFHSAHGDLWNILGSTIRRFGLTVNDKGVFLRIPEIELLDRKKSMVFLTDASDTILEFLGLDVQTFWRRFEGREEMFRYAAGCRMFWVREVEEEGVMEGDVLGEVEGIGAGASVGGGMQGLEGGEEGKKKLKHNDRQRMAKRPIFNEWISEFIPKLREEGKYFEVKVTREEIRDEAFERFGVKEEYETRLEEWKLMRHKEELWRDVIKGSIPIEDIDPALRAAAIRLLKLVIMEGEEWKGKIPKAARTEKGFYDVEEVRKFVLENWEEAGRVEMKRQQKRAAEAMNAKAEKKRLKASE